jgi:hypothetical protein
MSRRWIELRAWRPRGSRVRFCRGWGARVARRARERDVVQVRSAAAIEVNQATIARFEDGTAWPRRPEEVLMAYAAELDMDVRLSKANGNGPKKDASNDKGKKCGFKKHN